MWKSLYDWAVEFFSGQKWSELLSQGSGDFEYTSAFRNTIRNDFYPVAGILFIIGALIGAVIYYFILNRKGGSGYWFKRKYWTISLLLASFLTSLITIIIGLSMVKKFSSLHPFKYLLSVGIANFLYCLVLFFLISLVLKTRSVANTSPF